MTGGAYWERLIREDGTVNIQGQLVSHLAGKVAGIVLLLSHYGNGAGHSGCSIPPTGTAGKDPIVKRRQRGNGGDYVDTVRTNVANSLKEGR